MLEILFCLFENTNATNGPTEAKSLLQVYRISLFHIFCKNLDDSFSTGISKVDGKPPGPNQLVPLLLYKLFDAPYLGQERTHLMNKMYYQHTHACMIDITNEKSLDICLKWNKDLDSKIVHWPMDIRYHAFY